MSLCWHFHLSYRSHRRLTLKCSTISRESIPSGRQKTPSPGDFMPGFRSRLNVGRLVSQAALFLIALTGKRTAPSRPDSASFAAAIRIPPDRPYGRLVTSEQARAKATRMIARIKVGEGPDPDAAKPAPAPTVAERCLTEHVQVRCKPRTVEACRWLVKKFVIPYLGKMAIDAVDRDHVPALHHKHRDMPYKANRTLEVVRKMFSLAGTSQSLALEC